MQGLDERHEILRVTFTRGVVLEADSFTVGEIEISLNDCPWKAVRLRGKKTLCFRVREFSLIAKILTALIQRSDAQVRIPDSIIHDHHAEKEWLT